MQTEEAALIMENEVFIELYNTFEMMADEAEETGVIGEDLPEENDEGDTEYKLKLCGVDTNKIVRRATQMKYRLSQGNGKAFYEVGV